MPSSGGSCLSPAKAPAPLETPTASNVTYTAVGTPGAFPALLSPVHCDMPPFLLSLLVVRLPLQDLR